MKKLLRTFLTAFCWPLRKTGASPADSVGAIAWHAAAQRARPASTVSADVLAILKRAKEVGEKAVGRRCKSLP